MLVLNRKKGETIVIGDTIRLTVIDVQGDQIKIGIDAPRNVSIYREEIYQEVLAANRQASQPGSHAEILKEMKKMQLDKK